MNKLFSIDIFNPNLNVGLPQPGMDTPTADTAEMVYISSLALLKMLKHGKSWYLSSFHI